MTIPAPKSSYIVQEAYRISNVTAKPTNQIDMRILNFLLLFLGLSTLSFSQPVDYTIPAGYEKDISKEDYKKIVDISVTAISKRFTIDKVKEGTVFLKENQGMEAFNLHNLIIQCVSIKNKSDWNAVIEEHFNNLFSSIDEQKKIDPSDFESIKKYLSIRVYPREYVEQQGGENNLILKTQLAGTYSVLMLDLPGAFVPAEKRFYAGWKNDTSNAFNIAQNNINKHDISKESSQHDAGGVKIEITILESPDYAGSYALDLQNNSPELVGEWGSAIAIPNKQIALLCKISKDKPVDFVKFIQLTKQIVEKYYRQHPQHISDEFFWYYKGKFTKIQVLTDDKGNINVISPFGLTELMTEK
jgi:hypothetical protein